MEIIKGELFYNDTFNMIYDHLLMGPYKFTQTTFEGYWMKTFNKYHFYKCHLLEDLF